LRARSDKQKAAIALALKEKVWPLLESKKVQPVIHQTFELEQIIEAHKLMESSAHIGKIMLKVAE
jgi:NADPH:quinone reductase